MGQGDTNTALHEAAREGNVDAARSCLSDNPDAVNWRDRLSRTPLHLAAWAGHSEVVRLLCERNADVGAAAMDDMAAIHFACQKGHTEVVRVLLAGGAQVNARNRKGMTPLHFAAQGQREELTKLLINKGANLSTVNKAGKTPIDLVSQENFRALITSADIERKARKATKTVKDKHSIQRDVASEPQPKEVTEVEQNFSSLSETTRGQNEDAVGGLVPSQDDDAHVRSAAVLEENPVAKEQKEDHRQMEPRKKKAKVSLSHLTADDEDVID